MFFDPGSMTDNSNKDTAGGHVLKQGGKVAVIVLDGMGYEVLEILFQKDAMPYLKELSSTGTNLTLQTDIPLTGSSWASMVTGKKPFESGFNDAQSINSQYQICQRSLATDTIWHLLNNAGKSVGLFNAPYVYPVFKLNGFCVTGKGGGGNTRRRDFTYPYSIKKELLKKYTFSITKQRRRTFLSLALEIPALKKLRCPVTEAKRTKPFWFSRCF